MAKRPIYSHIDMQNNDIDNVGTITANDYVGVNWSMIEGKPSSLPASDVYAWAKAASKPSYNFSEIGSRGETYLGWGGQNLVGGVSPVDAAIVPEIGTNKLAFTNAGAIVIEYSTDGGATWKDYGASDDDKRKLVTLSAGFNVGKAGKQANANSKLRITIKTNASGGNVYTSAKKLLLNVSTEGSSGSSVLVQTMSIGEWNGNRTSWSQGTSYSLGGWSGWNSIPFGCAFGGNPNQTSQVAALRMTFSITAGSTTYNNLTIYAVRLIGITNWSVPSSLASSGHLYLYDINQNATFPAHVNATALYENGTLLADKYQAKGNYLTSHQSLANQPISNISGLQTALDGKSNTDHTHSQYLTAHQSLENYATKTYVDTAVSNLVNSAPETLDTLQELSAALGNDPNFATTVANNIGAKYTKPSAGIPKTDLASAVQTSLGKADSALQSHQDISGKLDKSASGRQEFTSTGDDVAISAAANKKLKVRTGGTSGWYAGLDTDSLTAYRTFSFPNKSGTFALTSDIPEVSGVYEPIISSKGTAFNKSFGTGQDDVARGNHTHSQYLTSYTEKYTGTVKSVNNVQPDASGNVTIATGGGGGNGTVNVTERSSDEYDDFWLIGVKQPVGNNQAVKSICERDPSDLSDIRSGAYWDRYNSELKVIGDVNCNILRAVGVNAQNVDHLVARLGSTSDKFFLHPNASATNSGYKSSARAGYFYEAVEGSTSGFSITYYSSSSASATTTASNVHIAYVRASTSTTSASSSFCIITYMDNSMTWKTITCYVRTNINASYISGACKVRQKTNTY